VNNATQASQHGMRMKANRRTIESPCPSCGQPFEFGEEVLSCMNCGGFHHAGCWSPVGVCGAATVPTSSTPPHADPVVLGDNEQYCSRCGKVIRKEALKCPSCGSVVDHRLANARSDDESGGKREKKPLARIIVSVIQASLIGALLVAYSQQGSELRRLHAYVTVLGKADAAMVELLEIDRDFLAHTRSMIENNSQAIQSIAKLYPTLRRQALVSDQSHQTTISYIKGVEDGFAKLATQFSAGRAAKQ